MVWTYRIIEQLLDPSVNVFALLLPDQQVDVVDAGAGAQQLVEQNLSHEAWKREAEGETSWSTECDSTNSPVPPVTKMFEPS